jgi:predicted ATPase/class 3 adenylate cyclase
MTIDGAPQGPVVTLVFTDIQDSTPLGDANRAAMREALHLHDAVLRDLLSTHRGYEFRTEGDAFKVAFESPVDAVKWCLAVQRGLLAQPWPEALLELPNATVETDVNGQVVHRGLRVRMGAHLGTAEVVQHPVTKRADFFGPMVNETARIAGLPAGGQTVVSSALWQVARRELPHVRCASLGAHRLRGVAEPVQIFDVRPPDLDRSFPPLRGTLTVRTNLPPVTDAFAGRSADLAAVHRAFESTRCVTLLGPGGTGKTRLSMEHARRQIAECPGGVWFCDASDAVTIAGLVQVVATTTGAAHGSVDDLGQALGRLGATLLVLDNLEQLPARETANTLQSWLAAAPEARFLLTSRHPLRIRGEVRLELQPLRQDAAIELLSDRMEAIRGRALAPAEHPDAGALVEALDRMPLAIELAAARTDTMDLSTVRSRLNQRFRLLRTRGHRPTRQATLRGAIDWSWDLLDAEERVAAAQCSVFAGGFDVGAAEVVVDVGDPDAWVVDILQSLRQKSILHQRQEDETRSRLAMYVAIREYASEHVGESAEPLRDRHARWASELAWQLVLGLDRPGELEAVERLRAEGANLETARQHATNPRERARLGLGLVTIDALRGPGPGAIVGADATVSDARATDDAALLCRALAMRARLHRLAARPDSAMADTREALAIARDHGLTRDLGELLVAHALLYFYGRIDREEVDAILVEALQVTRASGDRAYEAVVQAHHAYFEDDLAGIQGAVEMARAAGAERTAAWLSGFAPMPASRHRRFREAALSLGSQLATYERFGQRADIAGSLFFLAAMNILDGDLDQGRQFLDELREAVAPLDADGLRAVADLGLPGLLDLAEANRATEPSERARRAADGEAKLARLQAKGPNGEPSWEDRSVPIRHLFDFFVEPLREHT